MAQQLLGSYWFRGTLYGAGGSQELPKGDDKDTQAFLAKINEREQIQKQTAESAIDELLETLPAGHPYRVMFAARNSQPEEFDGVPSSNLVAPPVGVTSIPDGATVSGVEQRGALADDATDPIMQPPVGAIGPVGGNTTNASTPAATAQRAAVKAADKPSDK